MPAHDGAGAGTAPGGPTRAAPPEPLLPEASAGRLEAGQVQVNRYAGAGVEVPFGGYKNSGLGREKGTEAVHHYTQVKSVIMDIA